MSTCTASYLGGAPGAAKAIDEGQLVADGNGIRFIITTMVNMLPKASVTLEAKPNDMRGVSVGGAPIKRKGMMKAIAVAGVAGAVHHKATTGRRTTPVHVLVEQGGTFSTWRFATDGESAQALVSELNDARRNAGLAPLPSVEAAG